MVWFGWFCVLWSSHSHTSHPLIDVKQKYRNPKVSACWRENPVRGTSTWQGGSGRVRRRRAAHTVQVNPLVFLPRPLGARGKLPPLTVPEGLQPRALVTSLLVPDPRGRCLPRALPTAMGAGPARLGRRRRRPELQGRAGGQRAAGGGQAPAGRGSRGRPVIIGWRHGL